MQRQSRRRGTNLVRRTILAIILLAAGVGTWWLLGRWLPGGSERFYLLFPPTAIAVFFAAVPDGWSKLKSQLLPAAIYVALLIVLCTLYQFYLAAAIVPDGTGGIFHGVQLKHILVPAYFF